ncbi:MAG TPA: zinc-dependent metalloprotease [Candidatus Dormibacteraeota bacterium]|nr:zinc-dependent metalloprotease [Candidatus Dormibacteraeota bacterium]
MRRSAGRTALYGVLAGLTLAALAEAVRPRGGTALLLDWDEVRRIARDRLQTPTEPPAKLAAAASGYRSLARKLEKPLLDFVGPLPKGAEMPRFEALDREGWLDLNLEIFSRVVDPVLESGRMPNSLIVEAGRAGVNRYVGFLLAFLGRRVLGQYDPQLLGTEPVGADGLYLVETNVAEWERQAKLPSEDLRRWLILHEMTHAWQFAAHPWLRRYMEESMQILIESVTRKSSGFTRFAAFAGVLPSQWRVMRQVQGTMSVVEGYSNLVMNRLGGRLLPGFEQLEKAYRERSSGKSAVEVLVWRLTGLELKLEQYRVGEAFCREVEDLYGLAVLNRVWDGPESMPTLGELRNPAAWHRRVSAGPALTRAALPVPSPR